MISPCALLFKVCSFSGMDADMTMRQMQRAYLGTVPYQEALALQMSLKDRIIDGDASDYLLLLEHPPVVTLGRSASPGNVLFSTEYLASLGVEVMSIQRGGDVTYHGPGQLVGYPIREIGRRVSAHIDAITEALKAYLNQLGIESEWRDDAPGLWTREGKIAAVGVDARGGVTSHGFALNLSTKLSDYQYIVPCGLREPVTSVAEVIGLDETPSVTQAAESIGPLLAHTFSQRSEKVDPLKLRSLA